MRNGRCGFSVVEVLVVVITGVMILLVAYNSFISSSRVLTRGQNKMAATGQAELLFRYLENDFHSLDPAQPVAPAAPSFTLHRFVTRRIGPRRSATVTWSFLPGVDGRDSWVERRTEGLAPPEPPTRFCVGSLAQVRVDPIADPAHPGVSIKVLLKGVQDVTPAIFQETFFYQNRVTDPDWNPVTAP